MNRENRLSRKEEIDFFSKVAECSVLYETYRNRYAIGLASFGGFFGAMILSSAVLMAGPELASGRHCSLGLLFREHNCFYFFRRCSLKEGYQDLQQSRYELLIVSQPS